MWFREHGRVFDWGTLRWCQMQASPTNGCYDAETIALDEFGHIEILNHHVNYSLTSATTRKPWSRPSRGLARRPVGTCTPTASATRRPSRSSTTSDPVVAVFPCLDVATVLTLSISDTSIPYAGLVDFAAYLKAATNTDYGRLSANPIGGRTVRLQRRAIGSTTWTNLVTLPPSSTAGTYPMSLRLYGTADFRAVFSTPRMRAAAATRARSSGSRSRRARRTVPSKRRPDEEDDDAYPCCFARVRAASSRRAPRVRGADRQLPGARSRLPRHRAARRRLRRRRARRPQHHRSRPRAMSPRPTARPPLAWRPKVATP